MASLTFLGAAGTVTGSQYLLEADRHRVLIDCGMFQGLKALRERNWAHLPVQPASVESVVLTHAHLDHCGLLPRLVSNGFGGRIFCTAGTADLCKLVLPDAGRLQEEDAKRANRHRYSKHTPALPLFTERDADDALDRMQPFGFERAVPVAPGLEAEFINAGHLLGSAFVRMRRSNGSGGWPLPLVSGSGLPRSLFTPSSAGPMSFEYGRPKCRPKPCRLGRNSGWSPRCHFPTMAVA